MQPSAAPPAGVAAKVDAAVQWICRPKILTLLTVAWVAVQFAEQQAALQGAGEGKRPAHLAQRDREAAALSPAEMERRRDTVLKPMLSKRSVVSIDVFITPQNALSEGDTPVGQLSFVFGALSAGKRPPPSLSVDVPLDDHVMNNGSLWMHLQTTDYQKPYMTAVTSHKLMKFTPPPKGKKLLLGGADGGAASPEALNSVDETTQCAGPADPDDVASGSCPAPAVVTADAEPWRTHFQNKVTFGVLEELDMVLKLNQLPSLITDDMTVDYKYKTYHPVIWENSIWREPADYTVVNASTEKLNVTVDLQGMGLIKYSLYKSFAQNKDMGFVGRQEVELLKGSPYILAAIVIVSVLHSVFNILAFKNDISFWRQQKNMKGQSMTVLVVRFGMQLVIFLYLLDMSEGTSRVVIYNFGLGLAIDLWKIIRAVSLTGAPPAAPTEGVGPAESPPLLQRVVDGVRSCGSSICGQFATAGEEFRTMVAYFRPAAPAADDAAGDAALPASPSAAALSATVSADQQAARWLFICACPLLLAYSVYSLVYDEHKGVYSFVLHTLVRFIYWFGFAMMTPQLFINYKLKSVAHMPWRAFVYKAIGTFIDDMFAFAIEMPMAHRLSCLRDDLIFLVFVYQYYKYKVDHTRVNEFGQIGLMGLSVEELQAEKAKCEAEDPATADTQERLRDIEECLARKEKAAEGATQAEILGKKEFQKVAEDPAEEDHDVDDAAEAGSSEGSHVGEEDQGTDDDDDYDKITDEDLS
eukprot:TRINITY_DN4660_c0_g1_i1.p1 TRINITY_DN4660_c0_g1~~TRINITY_DN4660_c0_g1_i1.p1  ORF type:complete len:775 (+),score=338.18 TRINITY_DN4660_c0_g1_i1:68-2326(+)